MSFIEYFDEQYDKYRKEAVTMTKKELHEHKRLHHNFNYALNAINDFFFTEKKRLFPPEDEQMTKLYQVYNTRGEIYDSENMKLILDNEVFMEYEEMKPDFSFKYFIDVLAKREAYFKTNNKFRNYSSIYEMMFRLNKFDNYKNMKEFDILEANQSVEGADIYVELRSILYKDDHLETIPKISKGHGQNFQIKEGYHTIIKSEKFYKYLIENDVLDKEKNSYDNFYAFFNKEFDKQPQIYFECHNYSVAYLFYSLKDEIFQRLNLNWLFSKGLVISKLGKVINNNSIKQSYKHIKEKDFDSEHIENSKDAINYLTGASKKN